MTLTSEDELPTDVGEESGVFLSVGAGDAEATKYTSRLTFFLPLLQVLLGVLCVILQIFVVVMETNAHYVTPPDNAAPGIWCGALYLVTGLIGAGAARRKHKAFVWSYFGFSIASAVSTVAILAVSGAGIHHDESKAPDAYMYMVFAAYAGQVALLVVATLLLAVFIASAVTAGRAVCHWPTTSATASYQPLVTRE